ncbi:MAG TPA: methyltransferase, TIGR04325 family [Bacteroidia bacterium]|jgi:putative methyltransferase (TIGR04325 family)|nr:methyltransferase, TIGR04325 family [Bacteroidia bacterium]
MSLKDLLPPIVLDFIRKNRRVVKYDSYEEALSHCKANAYQNEELCNIIADKTLIHIESLKKIAITQNPTTVYLAFALNYFTNAYCKKSVTVLDFGGACGAHYYEVRGIIPRAISLKWVVVETEPMIRSAVSRGFAKGELSFMAQIENIEKPIDFVHSSSALQYVSAPYDFLKKLVNVSPKMILFNRMMFNKSNYDIITIQRSLLSSNGPGKLPPKYIDMPIMYPHTTMAIDKMNSVMTHSGYECLSEFDEPSGRFSLGKEEILGKGLLFIKR